jgi:glycosyltransferase involved in cell wall biosynthesis
VLSLVGDEEGCSAWRVMQPAEELQRQGAPVGAVEWSPIGAARVNEIVPAFDAVVLPRAGWRRPEFADQFLAPFRKLGMYVWYEADDDLFSPWFLRFQRGRGGLRRGTTRAHLEVDRQRRLDTLRRCDGVTVSTQRLATTVRQYTDAPVEVVPNALDLRWFRRALAVTRRRVPGGPPVTIGWSGGRRPERELVTLARAWAAVAARHPEVGFVVAGHQPLALAAAVPRARLRAVPWRPIAEYPGSLAGIDIACCPVEDVPFNRCKSPIKAWESAAAGSAVVASPTVYRQTITHGEDGLLCASAEEWEAALERLLADEAERRHLAAALLARVVRDHRLEDNAWRWPAAWARLAARAGEGRRAA